MARFTVPIVRSPPDAFRRPQVSLPTPRFLSPTSSVGNNAAIQSINDGERIDGLLVSLRIPYLHAYFREAVITYFFFSPCCRRVLFSFFIHERIFRQHHLLYLLMMDLVTTTVSGAAFGAALTASGVWNPATIIEQMRFNDFHMVKVFMMANSASA